MKKFVKRKNKIKETNTKTKGWEKGKIKDEGAMWWYMEKKNGLCGEKKLEDGKEWEIHGNYCKWFWK